MKWNCDPQECEAGFEQLILDVCHCGPSSFKTYKVPADTEIKYGAPVKEAATAGEVEPALAADADDVIGFAYGEADTRAAPDGNPDCNEICVLVYNATIKANAISYPDGTTQAEARAILDATEKALRIQAKAVI